MTQTYPPCPYCGSPIPEHAQGCRAPWIEEDLTGLFVAPDAKGAAALAETWVASERRVHRARIGAPRRSGPGTFIVPILAGVDDGVA